MTEPEDPNVDNEMAVALAALSDMTSGYADAAIGMRNHLVHHGFNANDADHLAAEFTMELARTAFTERRVTLMKPPPSWRDLFRPPDK